MDSGPATNEIPTPNFPSRSYANSAEYVNRHKQTGAHASPKKAPVISELQRNWTRTALSAHNSDRMLEVHYSRLDKIYSKEIDLERLKPKTNPVRLSTIVRDVAI